LGENMGAENDDLTIAFPNTMAKGRRPILLSKT